LLTRSLRMAAARNQADQVNLELLWAEWQTVAQARLLFDQVLTLRAQHARLEIEQLALAAVEHDIRTALNAENLTYDSASAGLNAGADLRKRLADGAIALHQAESDLHMLLSLAPTAPLDLVGTLYQVAPTPEQVQQALLDLPRRRPDLLAGRLSIPGSEAARRCPRPVSRALYRHQHRARHDAHIHEWLQHRHHAAAVRSQSRQYRDRTSDPSAVEGCLRGTRAEHSQRYAATAD